MVRLDTNVLLAYPIERKKRSDYNSIGLLLVSPSGDSLWGFQIKKQADLILTDLITTKDQNIIVSGVSYIRSIDSSFIWIIKLNKLGKVIWEKEILNGTLELNPEEMAAINDDQFLMTVTYRNTKVSKNYFRYIVLMDEDGNEIWRKDQVPRPYFFKSSLMGLKTGDILLGQHAFFEDQNSRRIIACIKAYNIKGDNLWEYCTDSQGLSLINSMTQAANGDIIVVGHNRIDTVESSPFLLRLTSYGNLIWKRNIAYDISPRLKGIHGGAFNEVVEDDGHNIWIVGTARDTFPNERPRFHNQNVWVLKLTSDGCLLPNCTEDVQYVSDVITSTEGVLIYKEDVHRLVLSPNPTNGKFTIKMQDQSLIESYKINDMTGRIVQHKEHIDQSTIDVDLGGQVEGMYLVKLLLKDGVVVI